MENNSQIEEFIKEFFSKMGWSDISLASKFDSESGVNEIQISAYDAKFLIGSKGSNLDDLEHLLRVLIHKKFNSQDYFKIDVNNYRRERAGYLRTFAKSAAQKVSQTKKQIELPPMSSFERKIVHMELASRPDVITESEGQGEDRHIVIRPYE